MKNVKHLLVHILDDFDHHVLRHYFYSYCSWVTGLSWWDNADKTNCKKCLKNSKTWTEFDDRL